MVMQVENARAGGVLMRHGRSFNALAGSARLVLAIVVALAVGKLAGSAVAAWVDMRLGIATKSSQYTWRQLVGAGALAGISFTMRGWPNSTIVREIFAPTQGFGVPLRRARHVVYAWDAGNGVQWNGSCSASRSVRCRCVSASRRYA